MFQSLKEKLKNLRNKMKFIEEKEELKKIEKKVKKEKGKKIVDKDVIAEGVIGRKLKASNIDDFLWDLELILLESDVALPVIEDIKENVKEKLTGIRLKLGVSTEEVVEKALRNAIYKVLAKSKMDFDKFVENAPRPTIIMFVGINGTGKTTVIAKIAHRLKKKGLEVVVAASDTFRAGAIEQLEKHCDRLGVRLIKHKQGSDPAAVAYDAIEHAKAKKKDVVLIDTAGRMQTNINLMEEMKKIKRVANPHMVVFVGDALSGNDVIEQAKKFDDAVGMDGVVLTKIDADAKGGAALSIAHAIRKPIMFVGTGQEYDDLMKFSAKWMVERLFEEV